MAVLRGLVEPAPEFHAALVVQGLGIAGVDGGTGQDALEPFTPLAIVFFPVDRGQEQHREAMAVHVPTLLAGMIRVADQTVALAFLAAVHEPVGGLADVRRILAVAYGAAFHQHGEPREARHGHRVVIAIGCPVAVFLLLLGQVVESLANLLLVLLGNFVGTGRADQPSEESNGRRYGHKRLNFQHVTVPRPTVRFSPQSGGLTGRRFGRPILTTASRFQSAPLPGEGIRTTCNQSTLFFFGHRECGDRVLNRRQSNRSRRRH